MKYLLALLLVPFASAANPPPAPRIPAPATVGDPAEEAAILMMENMAALVEAYGKHNDCPGMGAALGPFMDRHAGVIADIKALSGRQTAEEKKRSEEKYKARAQKAGEQMMGGVMKCMGDESVKAAMGKMKM